MTILVKGRAGYIGSHTVLYLKEKGENVMALTSMQKCHQSACSVLLFIKEAG